MKNMKRILLTIVSALLLMAVTVAGTLAYLQAQTDAVVNTFTYGNVKFVGNGLDEAPVDEYGEVIEGDRRQENTYKLIPGHKYHKDPTVHIAADTEPCWVFIKVVNEIADIEAEHDTIAEQMYAEGWRALEGQVDENGAPVENVYYYKDIIDTRDAAQKDIVVFSSFILKDNLSETEIADNADEQIWIDAYLIQADNLPTPEAAWAVAEPDFTNQKAASGN